MFASLASCFAPALVCGIGTVAELRRIGAVAAFNRVVVREGRAATANLLYALYAEKARLRLPSFPRSAVPSFRHSGVAFRMAPAQA